MLIRLLVVAIAVLMLIGAYYAAPQNPNTNRPAETSSGLRIVTLTTARGDIKVYLPDDIRAGDTVSGTVSAEPKGKDEKEKQKHAGELNGLVVEFVKQQWPVSGCVIQRLAIPATLVRTPELILLDEKGQKLDNAPLLVAPYSNVPPKPSFETPALGQSGRPLSIPGPFDGDSSNTKISVGGNWLRVISESPRGAVIQIPADVIGPKEVHVTDNGNTASGNFRALKIDLTAPKTSLMKGESTELHVQVNGLQGISQPVQVQLQNQTPSNINLSGGNTQNIVIQPSQVTTGGTFNWSGTVTGAGTGGFNITGTILAGTIPQTSSPSPTPSASPRSMQPATAASPQVVPVTASSAEIKKRCDELRQQLKAAKGPCEQKEKECADLERKLDAARAAADKAQADYDKTKAEFDAAMQTALNNLVTAARAKGFDTKLSLKKENDKYVPLKLADGVVIYFDATGLTDLNNGDTYIVNLANALKAMVSSSTINGLKQLAATLSKADQKNREAIAARLAAKQALDKCVSEKDALCPKVKELEAALAKCEKEAAAQVETERQSREKAESEKRQADDAKRVADEAGRKRKADEAKARAEAEKTAEEARRMAKERADKQKVCTRCLRMFVEQAIAQANLTAEQKSQIQQFLNSLDDLNGKLQNIQTAADLIPQLSQLSDLLGKLNVAADVINRVNTAINQIKQLAAGGNGPEQLGTAIQLAADALDAAAQAIPLLGPLASYFKVLADAVSASIAAAYALRDIEGMKFGTSTIDDWSKSCQVATLYESYDGDLDRIYNRLFNEKDRKDTIRETPEMRERLKQYLHAKIKECCLKMLKTQCPVLK
jgi:hypothetical protein